MTGASSQKLTPQEYLAIERAADFKSEFFDGKMFAMAGISKDHSRIMVNLIGGLHAALRGQDCEIFSSDLRVKVSANGLYTYPDLTIVCGPVDLEDELADVLLNPTLIIEVLSPGTERYERGKKSISIVSSIPSRNMFSFRRINIASSSFCVGMARNGAIASLSRKMTSSSFHRSDVRFRSRISMRELSSRQRKRLPPRCSRHKRKNRPDN